MELYKKFSPVQDRILKVLGNKQMRLVDLAEKVYKDEHQKPMSPRSAVRSAIQLLIINARCRVLSGESKLTELWDVMVAALGKLNGFNFKH